VGLGHSVVVAPWVQGVLESMAEVGPQELLPSSGDRRASWVRVAPLASVGG